MGAGRLPSRLRHLRDQRTAPRSSPGRGRLGNKRRGKSGGRLVRLRDHRGRPHRRLLRDTGRSRVRSRGRSPGRRGGSHVVGGPLRPQSHRGLPGAARVPHREPPRRDAARDPRRTCSGAGARADGRHVAPNRGRRLRRGLATRDRDESGASRGRHRRERGGRRRNRGHPHARRRVRSRARRAASAARGAHPRVDCLRLQRGQRRTVPHSSRPAEIRWIRVGVSSAFCKRFRAAAPWCWNTCGTVGGTRSASSGSGDKSRKLDEVVDLQLEIAPTPWDRCPAWSAGSRPAEGGP